MALKTINTQNEIRNSISLNKKLNKTCCDVIIQFEFDDLFHKQGTLHESDDRQVRLDLQGRTQNGTVNLQVQIGRHSVAAVLIAPEICTLDVPEHQGIACESVITILKQSLTTGTIWQLSGSLP